MKTFFPGLKLFPFFFFFFLIRFGGLSETSMGAQKVPGVVACARMCVCVFVWAFQLK